MKSYKLVNVTARKPGTLWITEFPELDARPGTAFKLTCPNLGWENKLFYCWQYSSGSDLLGLEILID